jgi:hypothetical protein
MSCKYEIIFKVFGSKKTEGPNQDSQHWNKEKEQLI